MTDGNTAIQVSPVLSEGEMKSFQDLFGRIANTITRASELDVKVTDLIHKVDDLSHSLEVAQARNSNLDEALLRVRTERDELSVRLSEARNDLTYTRSDYDSMAKSNAANVETIQALTKQVDEARKDRDDAQFEVLHLTEERDNMKAQLDQIKDQARTWFGKMIDAEAHPKPFEPVSQPISMAELPNTPPEPILHSEPVFVGEGDGFKTEEAKPAERRKVYRNSTGWNYDAWLAAGQGEYGQGTTPGEDWYYAKD